MLKSKGIEKVLITGGAAVNSAFLKEGLIDEIILNVEPFVIGKGIPLFAKDDFEYSLKLLHIEKIGDGIVQFHYEIKQDQD